MNNSFVETNEKGKLIFYPQKFAKIFVTENKLVTKEGTIFIYRNGYYNLITDNTMNSIIRARINNDSCKSVWISDSLKAIKEITHIEGYQFQKEFDNDKHIINVKNGVLKINFDTGDIVLQKHSSEIKSTIQLDVNYVYDVSIPNWTNFLNTSLKSDEERLFLQEIMGYAYLNYINGNAENIYFFHGEGGNGKGKIFDIQKSIMTERNILIMNEKQIINTDQNNQFFGFQFNNKLNVQVRETNYNFKNLTFIKDLVCGSIQQSEKKGSMEMLDTKFCGKVTISTNDTVKLLDTTQGVRRRAKFLLINEKIEKVIGNLGELLEKEKDGIFMWALEGLKRLIKNDFVHSLPKSHYKLLDTYMTHSNNFLSFIKKYISITPENNIDKVKRGISKENLFELFNEEFGNMYKNKNDFYSKFEAEVNKELKLNIVSKKCRIVDVITNTDKNVHGYVGIFYDIDKNVEVDYEEVEREAIKNENNVENLIDYKIKKKI